MQNETTSRVVRWKGYVYVRLREGIKGVGLGTRRGRGRVAILILKSYSVYYKRVKRNKVVFEKRLKPFVIKCKWLDR